MDANDWRILGARLLILGSLGTCGGCGAYGGTRAFTLPSSVPPEPSVRLTFEALAREPDASATVRVMVMGFSGYDASTEKNLASSLVRTIAATNRPAAGAERDVRVYAVVRRYTVAASSNSAAAMACVTWAMVEQDRVVFSEQFYAASAGVLFRTVGGIKTDVNKAIVGRIASRAAWFSRPAGDRGAAPPTGRTYDDFESAALTVPSDLSSSMNFEYAYVSETKALGWDRNDVRTPFDWESYLAGRGTTK